MELLTFSANAKKSGKTYRATVSVTVSNDDISLSLSPSKLTLKKGDTASIDVMLNGKVTSSSDFTWSVISGSDIVSVNNGKVTGKKVILSFPWASIGDLYDFAYNTNYLFSPVNEDDVVDGEYHGGYIYKYYNEKDGFTHYAVSRHIISPKAYTNNYPNLE
jgi:methionine aminopeptidase